MKKVSNTSSHMTVSNFEKALQDTGAQEERVIRDRSHRGKILGVGGMGGQMRRKGIGRSTAPGKARSKHRCLNG